MPTSSARCTTNTTVSHALKIYFWGNYFLNVVEYTGNLQGDYAFKTLFFFFFKERIGIFITFCFSKYPVDEGSPTDRRPFSSSLAARLG